MAIDRLQERIRKTKNPSVLQLDVCMTDIPKHILEASPSAPAAMGYFCKELLSALKGVIPAVRFSFASFALLGSEGLTQLQELLHFASENQYYTMLDAPELLSDPRPKLLKQAVMKSFLLMKALVF